MITWSFSLIINLSSAKNIIKNKHKSYLPISRYLFCSQLFEGKKVAHATCWYHAVKGGGALVLGFFLVSMGIFG